MPQPHRELILQIIDNLSHEILQGKVRALRIAMICLLSGGHLLLEDIPAEIKLSLAAASCPPYRQRAAGISELPKQLGLFRLAELTQ